MRSSMFDALVAPLARGRHTLTALVVAAFMLLGSSTAVQASPVATGSGVACAVDVTGHVDCDRPLDYGVDATGDDRTPAYNVGLGQQSSNIADATDVAAASDSACALRRSGKVTCWGRGYAHLTVDDVLAYLVSDVNIGPASAVATGAEHACAALRSGEAWCWGTDGSSGEFGDGITRRARPWPAFFPYDPDGSGYHRVEWDSDGPVRVTGIDDAVAIGAGARHSCAVLAAGSVRCWGAGDRGQLGNGALAGSATPVGVSGLTDARSVALGADHACALRAGGEVSCWGAGTRGQLGNGAKADASAPVAVRGLTDAIAVMAADAFSCALRAGGTVVCWGRGDAGRIGDGGNVDRTTPSTVDGLSGIKAIGAGSASGRACAAGARGVTCWGTNDSEPKPRTPTWRFAKYQRPNTSVTGIWDAERVQVNADQVCVERKAARLSCWGSWNDATGSSRPLATPVTLPFRIRDLQLLYSLACAATTDGELRCWDALDADGTPRVASPHPGAGLSVPGLDDVRAVAVGLPNWIRFPDPHPGSALGCAVVSGGAVKCWPIVQHFNGQQYDSGFGTPWPVDGITNAVDVVVAADFACVRLADRTVRCWTADDRRPHEIAALAGSESITMNWRSEICGITRLGGAKPVCWQDFTTPQGQPTGRVDSTLGSRWNRADSLPWKSALSCFVTSPSLTCEWAVPTGADFTVLERYEQLGVRDATSVSANAGSGCAVLRDGTVRCWGSGAGGEIGDGFGPWGHVSRGGRAARADLPEQVLFGAPEIASTVAAGSRHSCAVRGDGAVRCWGSGADGRLGTGSKGDRLKPARVAAISDARSVAVGDRHSCAVVADQTVRCWGLNYYGQLGDGHTGWAYKPVAVDGLTGVQQVAVGDRHTCALRSSGSVFCWGLGLSGRLGDGENRMSGTPVKVTGLSDAVAISAGSRSTCAVRATGAVVCWGAGVDGRLGNGSTAVASTPAPVTGITTATSVAVGDGHACAVLTSGEVRCWGRGGSGQLGDGTSTDRPTPVSVAGIDSAAQVVTGASHTCALLGGGTMRCWGAGADGQLGQGTTERSATPVAVNEIDDATGIAAGGSHTCVRRFRNPPACFGHNIYAQLGGGNTVSSSSPVDVLGGLSQIAY